MDGWPERTWDTDRPQRRAKTEVLQGFEAVITRGDTGFYRPDQEQIQDLKTTTCQSLPWAMTTRLASLTSRHQPGATDEPANLHQGWINTSIWLLTLWENWEKKKGKKRKGERKKGGREGRSE